MRWSYQTIIFHDLGPTILGLPKESGRCPGTLVTFIRKVFFLFKGAHDLAKLGSLDRKVIKRSSPKESLPPASPFDLSITTQGQTAHQKPPATTGPGIWGRPPHLKSGFTPIRVKPDFLKKWYRSLC